MLQWEAVFAGVNLENAAMEASQDRLVYASHRNLYQMAVADGRVHVLHPPVHAEQVHAVCLRGCFLVACSADGVLSRWRWVEDCFELEGSFKHKAALLRVDFVGEQVYALDGQGNLLQLKDLQLFKERSFGNARALTVAMHPKGDFLAVALSDCTIRLLDSELREVGLLSGHKDWVNWLAWSTPHGETLASAGADGTVRLWERKKGQSSGLIEELVMAPGGGVMECVGLLEGHDGPVHKVAWQEGGLLFSASADGTAIVWREGRSQGQLAQDLADDDPYGLLSVGYHGECLVGHTATGNVCRWAWPEQTPQPKLTTGHFGPVEDVAWLPDGRSLLSCSADQTTRLWAQNENVWREVGRPQVHGYDLRCLASFSDGRFVSGAEEKVIRVFRPPTVGQAAALPALGLSNRTTISSSDDNGGDAGLWPEEDKLYGHVHELQALAISPDGRWLASAAKANQATDAAIRLWSIAEDGGRLTPAALLPGHTLTVCRLRWSPSGGILLATSRDRHFSLHTPTSGMLRMVEGHARIIWDAAWLDEQRFVTVSRDRRLKQWHIEGDQPTFVYEAKEALTACAYEPTRGILAVGTEEGGLLLFNAANLDLISSQPAATAQIKSMAWSPNGRHLAIAAADHSLRLGTL